MGAVGRHEQSAPVLRSDAYVALEGWRLVGIDAVKPSHSGSHSIGSLAAWEAGSAHSLGPRIVRVVGGSRHRVRQVWMAGAETLPCIGGLVPGGRVPVHVLGDPNRRPIACTAALESWTVNRSRRHGQAVPPPGSERQR